MQTPGKQRHGEAEANIYMKGAKKEVQALIPLIVLIFLLALSLPNLSQAAEKKTRKPPVQKDIIITDSNLQQSFKKAEELLKKGDAEGSLRVFTKIYDYTNEVLIAVKFIQSQYDKVVNDPAANQNEKEDLLIKLKRIKQLTPKYTGMKITSAYNIGYIYARAGDSENARKYLSEVLEAAPFSTRQDSTWMKTKTLLLRLYGLEGEF